MGGGGGTSGKLLSSLTGASLEDVAADTAGSSPGSALNTTEGADVEVGSGPSATGRGLSGTNVSGTLGTGGGEREIFTPRWTSCWACISLRSAPAEIRLRLMRMSIGRVRRRMGTLRSDSRFFLVIVGGRIASYLLSKSMNRTKKKWNLSDTRRLNQCVEAYEWDDGPE